LTTCIELPVQHTAGLTFQAAVEAAGHPAPAWTITLHLRGPSQINMTAAPDGTFSATATETAAWAAGTYWWAVRATDGTVVDELESGIIEVLPDPVAATGAYDGRSDNEKALAAIDATLGRRATIDQQRYVINNRELWRTPIPELIKLRAFYAAAVARERRKARGATGWGRPVHVRFS
jgi:hypothetical protein